MVTCLNSDECNSVCVCGLLMQVDERNFIFSLGVDVWWFYDFLQFVLGDSLDLSRKATTLKTLKVLKETVLTPPKTNV